MQHLCFQCGQEAFGHCVVATGARTIQEHRMCRPRRHRWWGTAGIGSNRNTFVRTPREIVRLSSQLPHHTNRADPVSPRVAPYSCFLLTKRCSSRTCSGFEWAHHARKLSTKSGEGHLVSPMPCQTVSRHGVCGELRDRCRHSACSVCACFSGSSIPAFESHGLIFLNALGRPARSCSQRRSVPCGSPIAGTAETKIVTACDACSARPTPTNEG